MKRFSTLLFILFITNSFAQSEIPHKAQLAQNSTEQTASTKTSSEPTSTSNISTADSIGQMVWVKGTVNALGADKTPRKLERRSPIFLSDTIETDDTSTGQASLTDGSTLALNVKTKLVLATYTKNVKEPENNNMAVNMVVGGARLITGQIAKTNPQKGVQVKTETAVLAVRGTDVSVNVSDKGKTIVGLNSGTSVEVTNNKGSIILKPCEEIKNKSGKVSKSCKNTVQYVEVNSIDQSITVLSQMPKQLQMTNSVPLIGVKTQPITNPAPVSTTPGPTSPKVPKGGGSGGCVTFTCNEINDSNTIS